MTDLSGYAKKSTADGDTRSGLRLRLRRPEPVLGRCEVVARRGSNEAKRQAQSVSRARFLIMTSAADPDSTVTKPSLT